MTSATEFDRLLRQVRACTVCEAHLPLGPRPVLQVHPNARLLIVGQAPGTKVHASGIPWADASGERLRAWLGIDDSLFYDATQVAIMPIGFCYPGRGTSGDLPPRPECAPRWFPPLLAHLRRVELTLPIGTWAQRYLLGASRKDTLAETVRSYADYQPRYFPLPHPSPRNTAWLQRHPWFERDVLPSLRQRVQALFAEPASTRDTTGATTRGRASMRKPSQPSIALQRAYDEPGPHDGYRVLVDHFWPRGRKKEALRLDQWARELAPSAELIHWYGHAPERWEGFRTRYLAELATSEQQERLHALLHAAQGKPITLVYGARTETGNQAIVLREALLACAGRDG
ncbi:MAG: DUF488 family protein [Proteobacteria bacterium]|nr:DUF488 family protein [Pseudomonadota bacterium]